MTDTIASTSSKRGRRQLGPAVQRLRSDPSLHRAFRHLHRCGPQPIGYCFAEALDATGTDPALLDHVLTWLNLDPDLVATLDGSDFPPPSLDLVEDAA
jgi:hypothetical protein